MTPESKANELVQKYFNQYPHMTWEEAKQCALIAVDEILGGRLAPHLPWKEVEHWNKVKEQIELL